MPTLPAVDGRLDELAATNREADELRRLPDEAWKLLHETGVLRALQPARFGGGEVHLVDFLDTVTPRPRSPSAAR